jgi:hypothetical protein
MKKTDMVTIESRLRSMCKEFSDLMNNDLLGEWGGGALRGTRTRNSILTLVPDERIKSEKCKYFGTKRTAKQQI